MLWAEQSGTPDPFQRRDMYIMGSSLGLNHNSFQRDSTVLNRTISCCSLRKGYLEVLAWKHQGALVRYENKGWCLATMMSSSWLQVNLPAFGCKLMVQLEASLTTK